MALTSIASTRTAPRALKVGLALCSNMCNQSCMLWGVGVIVASAMACLS